MKTILRTAFLTALVSALSVNVLMASEQTETAELDFELVDGCAHESRRPIAEVLSGRCTERKGPSYFAQIQPDCHCVLEHSRDGLPVLRLKRTLKSVEGLGAKTLKPAVFRAQPQGLEYRAYAI